MFLDISKAFGKVWHEGLIFKLKLCVENLKRNILKCWFGISAAQVLVQKFMLFFLNFERKLSKISFLIS